MDVRPFLDREIYGDMALRESPPTLDKGDMEGQGSNRSAAGVKRILHIIFYGAKGIKQSV